jgi:hypothetical protein
VIGPINEGRLGMAMAGEDIAPSDDKQRAHSEVTRSWLLNPEIARTIPYWFFAAVGLVYASGFVSIELYLGTFGLRDVGADFWKARYIHVGFLCSVFPILPVLTAILMFNTAKRSQSGNQRWLLFLRFSTGLVLYLIPQMAFFMVVFLGRRADPSDAHYIGFAQLGGILLVSLMGGVPIVLAERFFRIPPPNWKFPPTFYLKVGVFLRVCVICVNTGLFSWLIWLYHDLIWEMAWYHILPLGTFILCTVAIPAFPVLRKWYAGEAGYPNLGILTVCFAIPVYYLSLVTFSSSMLGYLPASRGGGDYSVAPQVIVKLNKDVSRDAVTSAFLEQDSTTDSPANGGPKLTKKARTNGTTADGKLSPVGFITKRCVLIEETAGGLFIAVPTEAGGPIEWRKSQTKRPAVLAIDKRSILAVEYFPP